MKQSNVAKAAIPSVVVVGGGITGLAAAYTLQQEAATKIKEISITLVDAGQRLGGKIITDHVDGFTIDGGPDCFLRQKPWAVELANALGIQADLMDTNDHRRGVYILTNGRLTTLPDGVMLIVPTRITPFVLSPLITWPGKIRMGLDWFIPGRKDTGDESVADFVRRRLGREALEKIAEPLLSGIHVSDAEEQSLLATFPRFRAIEEKHASLIRGMLAEGKSVQVRRSAGNKPGSIFMTFKQGLGRLPEALETALSDCRLLKGTRVVTIERGERGGYLLKLSNDEDLHADALILTTPAYAAADLVRSLAPNTAARLDTIEYVSTGTISLAYRTQDIRKPFTGFGFMIPKKEKRRISACTWSSYKFDERAPDDFLLLRCFVGGPGKEDMVEQDDNELIRIACSELASILDLTAAPVLTRIYRWRKAHPQYHLGHLGLVRRIFNTCSEEIPGIYLAGAAYDGVGIPDCVRQGKKAAVSVRDFLQKEAGLSS